MPEYSPAELEKAKDILSRTGPRQIHDQYLVGNITSGERREALTAWSQAKHALDMQGGATGVGEVDAYIKGVVEQYQKIWARDSSGQMGVDVVQSLMLAVRVLGALDIPGDLVERKALQYGASPGLAYLMNWAVWIPVNFVGLGTWLKPVTFALGKGAKGVEATAKASRNFLTYLTGHAAELDRGATAATKAADLGKVSTAAKAGEAAAGVVVKAGPTIVPESRAFVEETAEAFGVTKELLEEALTSPQKLEALSVDQLLDFYRLRAQEQVRKGVTHTQTEAEQVGAVTFEDLVTRIRGTGATAAEAKEMIFLGDQILKGLDTFLERALPHVDDIANGTRPELIAEWKSHVMALAKANPAILGATGEIGRGLEILKTVQPELGAIRAYDGILQALGGEAMTQGTTQATAAAMQRFALLGKQAKASLTTEAARGQTSDFLHRMYKSLLLVMPSTQIVNTVGSIQGMMGKVVEQTGAALMPFAKGGPSVHEAVGMWAGLLGNIGKVPELWRRAVEGSAKRFAKQEVAGVPTDVVTRYGPLRWIGIEDELVGAALENALVTGKLVERGLNQGLSGAGLKRFLDESLGNPQLMDELTKQVTPMVDEALFRAPLSQFSEGMIRLKNDTGLDYYLPFVRTFANLIKQEMDWLPGLQMLRGKFWKELKDPALEGAARTRLVLGWMGAQNIYAAAKAGIITGGGPTDPELNRQWRQNNIPYTIHGVSYRAWEPAASVISAIADFADISNQLTEPNIEEFSGAISVTLGRLVENNYWLRVMEGVSQFVTGVKTARQWEDMMLTTGKVFLSPAVTVATGGPAGGRVRELLDPEVKDIRNLVDFYKSKTPGWSKDVPPLLNYSGEPMLIPPAIGGRAMNIFLSQARVKDQRDPVAAFLVKHDLTVEDQWKHFEGLRDPDRPLSRPTGARLRVNLDANESFNWKRLSLTKRDETGRSWVERIAELDQDPGFLELTTFEKQAEITREWATYREFGFDRLKQIDPKVRQRSDRADALTEAIRSGDAGALHREFGAEPDEGQDLPMPRADELEGREPETSTTQPGQSFGQSLGR